LKKPVVLMDMDDTLFAFAEAVLEAHNQVHLTSYVIDDWHTYYIRDWAHPIVCDEMHRLFNEPGFFASLKPHPEAEAVVDRLLKNFHVEVCSTPPKTIVNGVKTVNSGAAGEKIDSIRLYFPSLAQDIMLTDKKSKCRADIFVDDSPNNVFGWCEENPDGLGVLVKRRWNEAVFTLPKNAVKSSLVNVPQTLETWAKIA